MVHSGSIREDNLAKCREKRIGWPGKRVGKRVRSRKENCTSEEQIHI